MLWTLERVKADIVPAGNDLLKNWQKQLAYRPLLNWYAPIFDVEMTDRPLQEHRSMPSISGWPEWKENEPLHITEVDPLTRTTIELTAHADSFPITRMYQRFANAPVFADSTLYRDMQRWTKEFMTVGLRRHSEMAAGVLLNAFDSSAQAMRDGSALVADSHGDLPIDNKFTKKLGMALLEQFDQANFGVVGPDNEPVMYEWTHLVVSPQNRTKAKVLLETMRKPGGNDNDINPFWQTMEVAVCPYFHESIQTGSSEYVFVVDANNSPLTGRVAWYPEFIDAMNKDPMTIIVGAWTYFSYYALWSGGIAGSTGADAA